ncbi:MAG: hypothetical protein U0136_09515 [Bdellovibrionota bacterium]
MPAGIKKLRVRRRYRIVPPEQRIQGLYQDLSAHYDRMQMLIDHHLCRPSDIAVAAVLTEDLESLVQECEEYLIGGCKLASEQISSFESRTSTVLEEIELLGFLSPRAAGHDHAHAHH